jgi:hypothetical protein
MPYISKIEQVEKFIREEIKNGTAGYKAAWLAEKAYNVGVYTSSPSKYDNARLASTHWYFEVFYKRNNVWNRRAGQFFVKDTAEENQNNSVESSQSSGICV